MTQANAQDRDLASQCRNSSYRDPCLVRGAGAWRNHESLRAKPAYAFQGDSIVAEYLHVNADFAQILDQVVGEGIVIVDNEDHRGTPNRIQETAATSSRILRIVSA
jgi:hypothetical protein